MFTVQKQRSRDVHKAILLGVLMVLVVGCEDEKPKSVLNKAPTNASYDMTQIETKGNFSWMPLPITGQPYTHTNEILGALAAFEEKKPELEIINWSIESDGRNPVWLKGIWVQHRKRILKPENDSPK